MHGRTAHLKAGAESQPLTHFQHGKRCGLGRNRLADPPLGAPSRRKRGVATPASGRGSPCGSARAGTPARAPRRGPTPAPAPRRPPTWRHAGGESVEGGLAARSGSTLDTTALNERSDQVRSGQARPGQVRSGRLKVVSSQAKPSHIISCRVRSSWVSSTQVKPGEVR